MRYSKTIFRSATDVKMVGEDFHKQILIDGMNAYLIDNSLLVTEAKFIPIKEVWVGNDYEAITLEVEADQVAPEVFTNSLVFGRTMEVEDE